jgi:hypothetical protein
MGIKSNEYRIMNEQQQKETVSHLIGKWKYNDPNTNIDIEITLNTVKLIYNDVSEKFANNSHWFGENHLYYSTAPYFVRYANEEKLIFGKRKPGGFIQVGDFDWEYSFNRVE